MGDLIASIGGVIVAIVLAILYGKRERKAGRKDAHMERRESDLREAAKTTEKLNADRNSRADTDPIDRLRDAGRLRD